MSDILDIIKTKGYWRINVRPIKFPKENLYALSELRKVLDDSVVRLRGWDYPHIDLRDSFNGSNFIESKVDFLGHKELFRFYQSTQILHYFSMREDYEIKMEELRPLSVRSFSPANRYLEIVITLYRLTEILEFISRLIIKKVYTENIQLKIELYNTCDRQLFFWDIGRDLWDNYRCKSENLKYKNKISGDSIIADGNKIAVDIAIWIFERFNWCRVSRDMLVEEQRKILEKRL